MDDQPGLGHVLVVDDDENVRRLLSIKLRRAGASVDLAADGATALVLARAAPPTLVVLGDGLPDVDVRTLTAQLVGLDGRPGVVVLSNQASVEAIEAALRAGADDYVLRPFSPQELVLRLGVVRLRRRLHQHDRA
jgi:two-component system OmpR family response regulator